MTFNTASVSAISRSNGIQAYSDLIKEIRDATIPALQNYERFQATTKTNNRDTMKVIAKASHDSNRILSSGKPWASMVIGILEDHLKKEAKFEDLIEEVVPKDLNIDQLSSQAVQVALYIDNLFFVSSFARRLVMLETDNIALALNIQVESAFSKADIKAIRDDFQPFVRAVGQARVQAKQDIPAIIRAVPDFVVNDADMDAINATYGGKANPMAQNFISANWNPIFYFRSRFNDRQIKRYHVAKEERQNLEFKIQVLQQQIQDEGVSPALQRDLDYQTGRLKRLTDELEDIEEKSNKGGVK